MSNVTTRPVSPPAAPEAVQPTFARPIAVSAAMATTALLVGGLVLATGLAVAGWLLGGRSSDGEGIDAALQVGVVVWLTGHAAALRVDGVVLDLVPLAGPLLVLLTARRAGRWIAVSSAPARDRHAALVVLATGSGYGLAAAMLAYAAAPDQVAVSSLRAGMLAGGLVAAGVALGLARERGWAQLVAGLLPPAARLLARAAGAGLLAMLAAAAVTTLVVIAVHADDMMSLADRLRPDPVGAVLLVVLCLATLPNAVLWCSAYLLGPGFAVGTGTVVSPAGVSLGVLPAYPLLAALPASDGGAGWSIGLLALPVAAGAVSGVIAAGHFASGPWWRPAAAGSVAGAIAGTVLAGLLLVAGGAIGPGRLAESGPVPAAAPVAVGALVFGGLAGALARHLLRHVRSDALPGVARARSVVHSLPARWPR